MPMYSKIKRKEKSAKRKQIPIIAGLLKTNESEFVTLWVVNKIIAAVGKKKSLRGEY